MRMRRGEGGGLTLGLADVHPEAFEDHGEELTLRGHHGEDLLLDGGGLHLDSLENRRVEDVDSCVDLVAHKDLRITSDFRYGNLIMVPPEASRRI